MSSTIPEGFFAYPSSPPTVGETIRNAVSIINQGGIAHIRTWEDLRISGRVVIQEILAAIDKAQFFCVDLTGLNLNVLFELGYAITRNKVIWPILDNSFATYKSHFEQFRILTTIGYTPYQNSLQVNEAFYRDQPYLINSPTLFEQLVEPHFQSTSEDQMLYLKSRYDTEASIRLSKRISGSPLTQIVDDPQEVPLQYLSWYGTNIYKSCCVFSHLIHPDREGALLHNARYALVGGMAFGVGRRLLMLTEGDYSAPLDYREMLFQYKTATEAFNRLDEWLTPIEQAWLGKESARRGYMLTLQLATELKSLQIGEPIAENEVEKLVDYYFIETVAYHEALEGRQTVFYGRKGTGKSANFFKLGDVLAADRRNLVVRIKPIAYELQAITDLLARYREKDKKTYAVESLWKFLLISEIANTVAKTLEGRLQTEMSEDEASLFELISREDAMLRKDFSIRLERCVHSLQSIEENPKRERRIELDQRSISEALHEGLYKELRLVLGRILSNKKRIAILVDNLDKAWDGNNDLTNLAEFFLGLLSAARRLPIDFSREDSRRDSANITIAVFLRSDIFFKIKSVAREPDKINSYKLSWDDPELLSRVIEERFTALHAGNVVPNEIWKRYFCETVKGVVTKEFFFKRSLPRPRDLVYFIKAAVATAVNRRHPIVEENDILDAEKQYSQFAIESLIVESDLAASLLESLVFEFIGSSPQLTAEEVKGSILKVGVQSEAVNGIIDSLCNLRFIGVEVAKGEFRFADDPQEYKKAQILSRKLSERMDQEPRFMINPAYWAFLEVNLETS